MAELKPCDCKSSVRVCVQNTPEFGNIYLVHCDKCGNDSGWYETKQQAIDAWNKWWVWRNRAYIQRKTASHRRLEQKELSYGKM